MPTAFPARALAAVLFVGMILAAVAFFVVLVVVIGNIRRRS